MRNVYIVIIAVLAMAGWASADMLVGWDTTGGDPDYQAGGVTGTLFTGKTYALNTTAGSNDGTFGSTNGASTALSAYEVRIGTVVGVTNNTLGVQIRNNTGGALQLDSISFDYSRWFVNGPQDVTLTYAYGNLGGGITNQTVISAFTGIPFTGNKAADYSDFNVSLAGLSDRILADGQSATFNLIANNAIGASSSGAFDNIAIFGSSVIPEPATLGLVAVMGAAMFGIRRMMML